MLDCNFKEISILNMLLENTYVENEKVMEMFGISLRTVQIDIAAFNNKLKHNGKSGVRIRNERGKGYYLEYPPGETAWIKELKRSCRSYLDLSLNRLLGRKERVQHIIRCLLSSADGVKAEELADKLNISIATLNKEMRAVRKYLLLYQIQIVSIPYHGMKVTGEELAIRSCLIDFCDIYSYSEQNIFLFHCLKEYGITMEDIRKNIAGLKQVLYETGYQVPDHEFNRLVLYLSVLPLRSGQGQRPAQDFSFEFKELKEFSVAQRMLGENREPAEYGYLTVFLLVSRELSADSAGDYEKIVPEGRKACQKVMKFLKDNIFLDLAPYEEAGCCLLQFFYKWHLKNRFGITELEFSYSLKSKANRMISSHALANYIYNELPGLRTDEIQDKMYYELIILIYNLVYRIRNQYEPTNIILINEMGKAADPTVIRKLKLNVEEMNIHFHSHYLYEAGELDYSKYDYIFLPEGMKFKPDSFPIPSYQYDFFDKVYHDLWAKVIAKKRKVGAILNYMESPVIVPLECGKENLAETIGEYFRRENIAPGYTEPGFHKLIHSVIYHTDYVTEEKKKYINIFTGTKGCRHYYIFRLPLELFLNGSPVWELHFILLDLRKGLVEVKNGDSELRHYLDG
jgi:biotin operon repressor